MDNKLSISNLPLDSLEKLGINEDVLAKMPDDVRVPLMTGRVTPIVEARIDVGNGSELLLPVRLLVVPKESGGTELLMLPVKRNIHNVYGMNEHELNILTEGKVLSKMIVKDGVISERFFQLDPQTKAIIYADANELKIDEKLYDIEKINNITLGSEQRERIREGKPVELSMGAENNPVTVGVDLREPQGIRLLKNDFQEWERQQKIDYDMAHPEIKGYVMTDKNDWEYAQVIKAKSGMDESAKQELGRKSGFHL